MLKKDDRVIALRVFSYFKPYWFLILISILLSLVLASVPVLTVRYIKQILDGVFIGKNFTLLTVVCMGLVVLYTANGVCKYLQDYLTRYISESVSRCVRNELYAKYTGFSFQYYIKNKVGNMLSKVINDVVSLNDGLIAITILAKEPLAVIALLGYAFYQDWRLMSVTLIVAPALAILFVIIGRKVQNYSKKSLESIGDLSSALSETFSGIRIIKAFILERKMNENFQGQNHSYFKVRLRTARVEVLSSPLTEVVAVCAAAVMLYYGGAQVIKGKMTPGMFFGFLGSVGLILDPLKKINIANVRINTALAGAKRIFEVLDLDEKIYVHHTPKALSGVQNDMSFDNVSFQYNSDKKVLDEVSFKVKAGESIAFVGASGAGKTTLVNLIPRFYDVTDGVIRIDDTPIKEFGVESLRSNMALVTQETFLFNDTVFNNILYGNLNASKDDLIEAAKAANAHNFIMDLPAQYETQLGDRGMNLSGGQRQRIAIARALLRNAPILILDEATSALDSESEKLVQKAIERLMEGRTTFLIAHRLSTIKNANTIVVLGDGKIIESGTHNDLMDKKGAYYQYCLHQGAAH